MSRAMKDSGISWIGIIPTNWNVIRLKYLCNIKTGDQDTQDNNPEGIYPFYVRSPKVERSNKYTFEGNSILMAGDGVGAGRVFHLADGKFGCHQRVYCMRNFKEVDRRIIYYLLQSTFYYMIDSANSKSTVDSVRLPMLLDFPILLFSSIEQQIIANYLDQKCTEIDELIALQEKIIEELKLYKQAVITEAVTKGLNPNVLMKDSGIEWIKEIPEHWVIAPFKTIYRLTKGLTITKADLVENGIPVISYGQIHSKLNNGTSVNRHLIRYVPDNFLNNNVSSLVREGDIIFADTSEDLEGCGNCVYIDKDMTLFAGYHTIIAKSAGGSSNKYLAYLFKTDCWRYQLRTTVNGVKLFSISQKLLAATNILMPSVTEQQKITDYLDQKCTEIDELSNIKQQKIDQLKEYKKSIIYEYVTGKKQVK